MTSQAERSRLARDQLVAVVTQLFAERGYEDTSIEAVCIAPVSAGGAIYHHFSEKRDCSKRCSMPWKFWIDDELAKATAERPDPASALRAGCLTWISLERRTSSGSSFRSVTG